MTSLSEVAHYVFYILWHLDSHERDDFVDGVTVERAGRISERKRPRRYLLQKNVRSMAYPMVPGAGKAFSVHTGSARSCLRRFSNFDVLLLRFRTGAIRQIRWCLWTREQNTPCGEGPINVELTVNRVKILSDTIRQTPVIMLIRKLAAARVLHTSNPVNWAHWFEGS